MHEENNWKVEDGDVCTCNPFQVQNDKGHNEDISTHHAIIED